jgi:hypothetical protein
MHRNRSCPGTLQRLVTLPGMLALAALISSGRVETSQAGGLNSLDQQPGHAITPLVSSPSR